MSRRAALPCALSLTLALGSAALTRRAAAQSCTAGTLPGACGAATGATVTVPRVVRLALSTSSVVLAAPGGPVYDAGAVTGAGAELVVQANTGWVLAASAATAAWTAMGTGARGDKPSTDLAIALSPTGPFVPLGGSPVALLAGEADKGRVRPTYYRVRWDYALDGPGSYSLAVTFTITAP